MSTSEGQPARLPAAFAQPLQAFLDGLAIERGLSVNTIDAYRRDLTHHLHFLGGQDVEDLSGVEESQLIVYLGRLRRGGAAPATRRRDRRLLALDAPAPAAPPAATTRALGQLVRDLGHRQVRVVVRHAAARAQSVLFRVPQLLHGADVREVHGCSSMAASCASHTSVGDPVSSSQKSG